MAHIAIGVYIWVRSDYGRVPRELPAGHTAYGVSSSGEEMIARGCAKIAVTRDRQNLDAPGDDLIREGWKSQTCPSRPCP